MYAFVRFMCFRRWVAVLRMYKHWMTSILRLNKYLLLRSSLSVSFINKFYSLRLTIPHFGYNVHVMWSRQIRIFIDWDQRITSFIANLHNKCIIIFYFCFKEMDWPAVTCYHLLCMRVAQIHATNRQSVLCGKITMPWLKFNIASRSPLAFVKCNVRYSAHACTLIIYVLRLCRYTHTHTQHNK